MLYLHVSNRTENLLQHLVEVLRTGEHRSVFEKEAFLIQSQGMERMISQTLAVQFTSWCNFEFFLPIGFLQHSAALLGMQVAPDGYDRKALSWRIEELLREIEGEEYQSIKQYLQGRSSGLKRFQLAEQLANVFDQYQVMRPEMLAAWGENRLVTGEPVEVWQKTLWQRLVMQLEDVPHRGAVLQKVITELGSGKDYSTVLPSRLSVFGLSIMPPLFLQYLQGLADHSDVHLYVTSPCREYWGDIERRRSQMKPVVPETVIGGEMGVVPETHPLLVSLGQQGRDFQRMLFAEHVNFELEFSSYEDPLESGGNSLLRQLQSDLLTGIMGSQNSTFPDDDHSIQIVSCHSRLREIAILKEHILRALFENPDLQLRDIVVMAPDIQEYAALIPAVFDAIQHSISDRSLRRRNRVFASFADFMALFKGRFGWGEVLELLKEPVIAERFKLSQPDLDNLQRWIVESGIRWGLSGDQRSDMGLPGFSEGTWRTGIERLLMGYAIDGDGFVADILPMCDVEGAAATSLGELCQFLQIIEQAYSDFGYLHSLQEWSQLLSYFAGELFEREGDVGNSSEYNELSEILHNLGEVPGELHKSPVEFDVIASWLENTSQETRSSSGFLRGQLTFCSMLPMRSIPFEMVCLIGLKDGTFPKSDTFATFDIMGKNHWPGDRSRRMDDRYQFLEAIMAAREQLYISYIGQSIKNNDKLPPSVVVSELLEVLDSAYGISDMVCHHPLHPFSSSYYNQKTANLFSYDVTYCEVSQKIQSHHKKDRVWWSGKRDVAITDISLGDLFRFFSNPQRWFVRNCMGISVTGEVELIKECEIFSHTGLENFLVNQQLLDAMITGSGKEDMLRKLQATGSWPLGVPGDIFYQKRIAELEKFAAIIRSLDLGERVEDVEVDLEVSGCRLVGSLPNVYENSIFLCRYAKVKGKDLLSGWLHYLIYERVLGRRIDVLMLNSDDKRSFITSCDTVPDLETMVQLYVEGCIQPSKLYIEPAFAWVKKTEKGAGMFEAAHATLTRALESGYEPESELLLQGCNVETLLDEKFVEICETVVQPIWGNGHEH